MNKLKAIIIDDERLARVNLKNLLSLHPDIAIVDEASSCITAVEAILRHRPDVIFLDIQLTGESGFDILDKISTTIQVVFVTAFDEYAIRAFEINAVDYLLKPVNPKRLKETIARLQSPVDRSQKTDKTFEYSDSIYVKLNNKTSKFIGISSILYISPVGNYSKLHLKGGANCVVLKTLKQWSNELPANHFVRVHRSTIVNIEYINHIDKEVSGNYSLFLKNMDKPFEISRRYLKEVKEKYTL